MSARKWLMELAPTFVFVFALPYHLSDWQWWVWIVAWGVAMTFRDAERA